MGSEQGDQMTVFKDCIRFSPLARPVTECDEQNRHCLHRHRRHGPIRQVGNRKPLGCRYNSRYLPKYCEATSAADAPGHRSSTSFERLAVAIDERRA
jgi:hypothetical protein